MLQLFLFLLQLQRIFNLGESFSNTSHILVISGKLTIAVLNVTDVKNRPDLFRWFSVILSSCEVGWLVWRPHAGIFLGFLLIV